MRSILFAYTAMALLAATGCQSSHRSTIQGSSQKALSDSSVVASLADSSAHTADAILVAALSSAQASEKAEYGLRDTSRSTTVTEFGPDGLPVRVTETRQNDITATASVRRVQQLKVDAYLQQVREMNEEFSRLLMSLHTSQQMSIRDTLSQQAEKEPAVPAAVRCQLWAYLVGFCVVALVVLAAAWWRRFRNSIDCY